MAMWQSAPRDQRKRYELDEAAIAAERDAARAVVTGDGLITVSALNGVALAFLGMTQIRERQSDIIQDKLGEVADRARGRLAVSLAQVATLTSSGINAFVAVHARCAKHGGHLALFALMPDIRAMISITKLDRALIIADNVQEAVRTFDHTQKKSLLAEAFAWFRPDKKDAA